MFPLHWDPSARISNINKIPEVILIHTCSDRNINFHTAEQVRIDEQPFLMS